MFCKRGHERNPDNLYANGTCKLCMSLARTSRVGAHREQSSRWSKTESGRRSAWKRWLKYAYHLTVESYNALLLSQGKACKMCGVLFCEEKPPHVDHDHKCCSGTHSCGRCIRGLLCKSCNLILGLCNDSTETLENAIQYLKETQ